MAEVVGACRDATVSYGIGVGACVLREPVSRLARTKTTDRPPWGGQSMGIPAECEGTLNIAKLNTNCRGLRAALQDAPMVARRDLPLRTAVLIKRIATLMTSWPPRPASALPSALDAPLRGHDGADPLCTSPQALALLAVGAFSRHTADSAGSAADLPHS